MRSHVMSLVTRRRFDFSSLADSTIETLVAVSEVDVAAYGDAVLVVRVHENASSAGGSITVSAYSVAPSPEEPDVTFIAAAPAAEVTVGSAVVAPAGRLLIAGLGEAFGGCLQIQVTGARTQGAATVQADLSIDLVVRAGVAAPRRTLADTLVVGNTTGGSELVVSSNDLVRGEDGVSPTALSLRGGSSSGTNTAGANVAAAGGTGLGSGAGGQASVSGGAAGSTGTGGTALVEGGEGGSSSGAGGPVVVRGGSPDDGNGGSVTISGRDAATTSAANRSGGTVTIEGGDSTGTTQGGDIVLTPGASASGNNGRIQLDGPVALGSILSPSALASGSTNDYAPTGIAGALVVRQAIDAAGSTLTGLSTTGHPANRILLLVNLSTSATLSITHQDTGSSSSNRFICPGAATFGLRAGGSVWIWRDSASLRWRLIAHLP